MHGIEPGSRQRRPGVHPDRGLMMVSTHAFEDVETMLPVVNGLGETIVSTLSFTE